MTPELKKGIAKIKLMKLLGASYEKIEQELAKYSCPNCGMDWNTCVNSNKAKTYKELKEEIKEKICLEITVKYPGKLNIARVFTIYKCWRPKK